jgi:hypothetical protein
VIFVPGAEGHDGCTLRGGFRKAEPNCPTNGVHRLIMTETPSPSLPRPHAAVICRSVSDGAVLLHTEQELYYGLNSVGLLVWEGLPPAQESMDALCRGLSERFPDVPPEEIEADVRELLEDLERIGLVVPPGTRQG